MFSNYHVFTNEANKCQESQTNFLPFKIGVMLTWFIIIIIIIIIILLLLDIILV